MVCDQLLQLLCALESAVVDSWTEMDIEMVNCINVMWVDVFAALYIN